MKARYLAVGAALGTVALGAGACGMGGGSSSESSTPPPSASHAAAAKPFGAGCAAVPPSGSGSFTGMATDPVATAASHNPLLSTLVSAVKKAGLVDTLNSAQNITVFAPTNKAFAALPKATMAKVMANKKMLTSILTYHVAKGRTAPAAFASGKKLTSLQGGAVTISKSGSTYKADKASVACGNVHTANATVYIIDQVMMPPKM